MDTEQSGVSVVDHTSINLQVAAAAAAIETYQQTTYLRRKGGRYTCPGHLSTSPDSDKRLRPAASRPV